MRETAIPADAGARHAEWLARLRRRRPGRGTRASPRRRRSSSTPRRSRTPRAAARRRSQKSAQQSPSMQERLNRPGAPSDPRRPTASTCAARAGARPAGPPGASRASRCRRPGPGRREASTLARPPPRLWPTIAARRPCSRDELLEPLLEPRHRAPEQLTLATIPALLGRWPARRSQSAISASEPSPARKPGIRSTGWPRPSSTPSPRRPGRAEERPPRARFGPPARAAADASGMSPSRSPRHHDGTRVIGKSRAGRVTRTRG